MSRVVEKVEVPAWILAALVQDCRVYGLHGKYLDQAEDLLEARNAVDVSNALLRGPTKVLVAEAGDGLSCHGFDGEPCARLSDDRDPDCVAICNLRPCWKSPPIIWREVK